MIVYLSGPISLGGKLSPEETTHNLEKFTQLRERLREHGIFVLDPTELPKQKCWEDYMRLTIPQVCLADHILLLSGWQESRGSVFEVFLANTLGIPIVTNVSELL